MSANISSIFDKSIDYIAYLQSKQQLLSLKLLPKTINRDQLEQLYLSWEEFRNSLRLWHILYGMLMFIVTFLSYKAFLILPFTQHSVITAIITPISYLINILTGFDLYLSLWLLMIYLLIIIPKRAPTVIGNLEHFIPNLPSLALREEAIFRQDAENWTQLQRLKSNLSFGLIHFSMFIVPLGLCLSFFFSAAILMFIYLYRYKKTQDTKDALIQASIVHTAYNCILGLIIPIAIIITFINPKITLWLVTPW